MPIQFNFSRAELEEAIKTDKIDSLLSDSSGYFYKHMNNGSGICPECAPWLGMRTTGDGTDGVPVPPLHPRCKCFLMRADVAIIDEQLHALNLSKDIVSWSNHFEWMKRLSPHNRKLIIGRVRSMLIERGELQIEDLYDGIYFRPLEELGYDTMGNKLGLKMSAIDILKEEDYYTWLEAFHTMHFKELPVGLRGNGAGSSDGVALMLVYAIHRSRQRRQRRAKWLVELLVLLRDILPVGVALVE